MTFTDAIALKAENARLREALKQFRDLGCEIHGTHDYHGWAKSALGQEEKKMTPKERATKIIGMCQVPSFGLIESVAAEIEEAIREAIQEQFAKPIEITNITIEPVDPQ